MSQLIGIIAIISLNLITNSVAVFTCPQANGTYVNRDDYRSFYQCINGISMLQYCPSATQYYSTSNATCQDSPAEWSYIYDLTGTYTITADTEYRHVYQKDYDVYWTSDTPTVGNTFIGRYINETHIVGIQTRLIHLTGCTSVLNARMVAIDNKSFCYYTSLAIFGRACDLEAPYSSYACVSQ